MRTLGEALLLDSKTASRVIREHFAGMTGEQTKLGMANLRQSVRNGQPIRVGGSAGEAMRASFLKWATTSVRSPDGQQY